MASLFESSDDKQQVAAGRPYAESALELLRVREVRDHMLASLWQRFDLRQLKALAALERYERCALRKRRREDRPEARWDAVAGDKTNPI
jgi:hypothetical protein